MKSFNRYLLKSDTVLSEEEIQKLADDFESSCKAFEDNMRELIDSLDEEDWRRLQEKLHDNEKT